MLRCAILLLLCTFVCPAQSGDTLFTKSFPLEHKLLHRPPSPFFKSRPYLIDLFVDIPEESLERVSIFFKTESFEKYWETVLEKYRGRYRFKYNPEEYPGDTLRYFFVAITKHSGIYAVPLDKSGKISPWTILPLDPLEYHKPYPW